ncbi:glycerate kinase [Halalkalibacter nanhaiisediminis]|uniref:Glycerate kinase n=1 Tax=Halalkalibacter nanhaiisediminis TaxID=688079 RepID=A0A562QB24_9BACI|nr:glycerate kinase [Halalkalibacter nanhaiisediminis]TWI53961.1 glycerate kinase [Halalkalibacter nanhaiisediminis]
MRKIVIAPDSFKESFTAMQAADAIEKGFRRVFPQAEYVKIPMADGGEGTVQSLVDALHGTIETVTVVGPLGDEVEATYGVSGDGKVAVIEMAAASGLHLVPPDKRNPLITTTYGTGQLIIEALEKGVEHIIIGIGGSATNDGGAGLATALGVKLLASDGTQIDYGGAALAKLERVEIDHMHPRLKEVTIEVACDVDNPLLGEKGASAIYGPQKGANEEMVGELDRCLAHYADKIKETLGKDIRDIPGAGAAGGLGAGLLAFLNVRLDSGVTLILEATGFHERVKGASLVITGEGRLDQQTIFGKTPIGVAKAAKQTDIPVLAFAGGLANGHEVIFEHGIDVAFSIVPGILSIEDALENGLRYLEGTAYNTAKIMSIQQQME